LQAGSLTFPPPPFASVDGRGWAIDLPWNNWRWTFSFFSRFCAIMKNNPTSLSINAENKQMRTFLVMQMTVLSFFLSPSVSYSAMSSPLLEMKFHLETFLGRAALTRPAEKSFRVFPFLPLSHLLRAQIPESCFPSSRAANDSASPLFFLLR